MLKRNHTLGLALVLASGLTIAAESPQSVREARDVASKQIFEGERLLDKADAATSNGRRLDTLDAAIRTFKGARSRALRRPNDLAFVEIRLSADRGLVEAFDDKADIYLSRGSVWNAKRSVTEALKIDPDDARTLDLAVLVASAQGNVFNRYDGSIAAQRVVARRTFIGSDVR